MLARLVRQDATAMRPLIATFPVADAWCRERVTAIVESFLQGYNAVATASRIAAGYRALDGIDPFYRPFALEGAGMGYGAWALRHGRGLGGFEATMTRHAPQTVYQNYVGLGWWLAHVNRVAHRRLERQAARLDPVYRLLVFEGAGFRAGFFAAGDPAALAPFTRLPDAPAHVAAQGFGRSLWFSHMGRLQAALAVIEQLPPAHHDDAVSGLGLACAYSWLDRVDEFSALLEAVPEPWRPSFLQGAAFGWEARSRADGVLFKRLLCELSSAEYADVHLALSVVHSAKHRLDGTATPDFYQAWRAATRECLRVRHRAVLDPQLITTTWRPA